MYNIFLYASYVHVCLYGEGNNIHYSDNKGSSNGFVALRNFTTVLNFDLGM